MNDNLAMTDLTNHFEETQTMVATEEFFEPSLFQDILNMKSLLEISEKTATDLKVLQDQTYQNLFNFYQNVRGISVNESESRDEVFAIFELFFKNYYQYFRRSMEDLLSEKSPLKVAYYLGKNTEKFSQMLSTLVNEIKKEMD